MTTGEYQAYEAIWDSLTLRDEMPNQVFELNLFDSDYPMLHSFAETMNSCRVLEYQGGDMGDAHKVDYASVAEKGIDILMIVNREPEYIPEGVKLVAYSECAFTKSPVLPSSVIIVVYSNCTGMTMIDGLPDSVQKLELFEWAESEDEPLPLTIHCPRQLRAVKLHTDRVVTFRGEWSPQLKSVTLIGLSSVSAQQALPPSVERIKHYAGYPRGLLPPLITTLAVSARGALRRLDLRGTILSVKGRVIRNLDEYHRVVASS